MDPPSEKNKIGIHSNEISSKKLQSGAQKAMCFFFGIWQHPYSRAQWNCASVLLLVLEYT